ncbi:hypothetical protein ZWY2020_022740 [Hordeum vulgare]|nr:hypothetical protein ZWY2020_022740 [Hordeum vulgare]
MVASAERIGVPRESRMFRHALQAVAFLTEDKIAAQVGYLKKTFRWSDAEVSIAVCKAPCLLRKSKELLQRRSEFLISENMLTHPSPPPAGAAITPPELLFSTALTCLASWSELRQSNFLVSAAAPAVSANPSSFAVEEYLVSTCGLTRPQAIKASPKLSHLKSPTNPDAVLAFLAGLGLSGADVAALVAKDPKFLCAKVERTLAPVVVGLTGLGLSRSQIARLISLTPDTRHFRCRSIISRLHYYLPLFGSSENLLQALNRNFYPSAPTSRGRSSPRLHSYTSAG